MQTQRNYSGRSAANAKADWTSYSHSRREQAKASAAKAEEMKWGTGDFRVSFNTEHLHEARLTKLQIAVRDAVELEQFGGAIDLWERAGCPMPLLLFFLDVCKVSSSYLLSFAPLCFCSHVCPIFSRAEVSFQRISPGSWLCLTRPHTLIKVFLPFGIYRLFLLFLFLSFLLLLLPVASYLGFLSLLSVCFCEHGYMRAPTFSTCKVLLLPMSRWRSKKLLLLFSKAAKRKPTTTSSGLG